MVSRWSGFMRSVLQAVVRFVGGFVRAAGVRHKAKTEEGLRMCSVTRKAGCRDSNWHVTVGMKNKQVLQLKK